MKDVCNPQFLNFAVKSWGFAKREKKKKCLWYFAMPFEIQAFMDEIHKDKACL